MLTDIISLLKVATDPKTRDTITAIIGVASRKQPNWKEQIRVEGYQFTPENSATINAFTNELFRKVLKTGISQGKLERFTTVYSELINNAYYHGCQGKSKWKIIVRCVYSRWFIQLEVSNSGDGFDIQAAMRKVAEERGNGKRHGKSGLELVRDLTDSMYVDGKKSKISIVIAGENRINITTSEELHNKYNLLVVTWKDNEDWSFLIPDWEPLNEVLTKATQSLILIRFGTHSGDDSAEVRSKKINSPDGEIDIGKKSTTKIRAAKPIITECALDTDHLFAYIISEKWVYEELVELETENLRFFRNESEAKHWLIETAKELPNIKLRTLIKPFPIWSQPVIIASETGSSGTPIVCPSCGATNVVGAVFCENCGTDLRTYTQSSSSISSNSPLTKSPTSKNTNFLIICPSCGNKNEVGAVFCDSCGFDLRTSYPSSSSISSDSPLTESSTSKNTHSLSDRLSELKELHEMGLIKDEEYKQKREEILRDL
jgi:anti-sigma regulatory factor (Ser/Thr protein kinase)/ribosomal protein L40E